MFTLDRQHVPWLTGILTVVSLALVFSAAGGAIPETAVPAAPAWLLAGIPHVNAAVSLLAIAAITYGWSAIRRGDVSTHRNAMGLAVVLFGAFLVLYLYRLVAIGGATPFDGPDAIRRFVYLPILVIHMGLAIVAIPLLYYVLLLVAAFPIGELHRTRHPQVGRVVAPLWIASFALGIVVYLLLYVLY